MANTGATIRADVAFPAASARILNVKGDSVYATGGYLLAGAVAAASFNLANASDFKAVGLNDGGTIIALVDLPNLKVKFITAATGAEVANASDQSAVTVKVLVYS
jgi:hypothetical protein